MEAKGLLDREASRRHSMRESISFLRRKRPRQQTEESTEEKEPGAALSQEEQLQLRRDAMMASSPLRPSMVALYETRELQFVENLPLKAPIAREHVCDVCLKHDCECEPESDDESEETEVELSQHICARILRAIRRRTDVVRNISGQIVNDQGFQMFIVILILLNCLVIGVATFDAIEDNPDASRAFRILDLLFLCIFTIELAMQFLFHGYNLFFDGWLLFDLFIVVTSWTLESISVLRALKLRSFRIFRAFRLTTRIRALRRLVQAIFDVLPKITAIIILFALVMYVFGVMCTELFGDIDFTDLFVDEQDGRYDYFSRLDYSFFTLFVMVTLDWAKVARATMLIYPWAWAIFVTFVTFSAFVLYNLVIAVVCDAVKMVQDKQDILMVENYVKDKLESRHRIINLRQKLDKMSKQQMDLLLYVKLMLEQLDDIDDESKQQYEETLLLLSQTNGNAKEVLVNAIQQLDEIDAANGFPNGTACASGANHNRRQNPSGSRSKREKQRVSFEESGNSSSPTSSQHEGQTNDKEFSTASGGKSGLGHLYGEGSSEDHEYEMNGKEASANCVANTGKQDVRGGSVGAVDQRLEDNGDDILNSECSMQ